MANTISAGNVTNGLAISADTTGALDIKTGPGAGTTAISISSSQVVTMNGGAVYPINSSEVITPTAVSSVNFTSIPPWVKRITVMLNNVSLSGTDAITIRIGDSGGLETTGYNGNFFSIYDSGTINVNDLTDNFQLTPSGGGTSSGTNYFGQAILSLLDASTNTWVITSIVSANSTSVTARQGHLSGGKTLTATLDRLTVITSGGNTFDNGTISILYE
jgi:hypothetical protein